MVYFNCLWWYGTVKRGFLCEWVCPFKAPPRYRKHYMLNDKTRQFHLQCSLENQSTRVCVAQRTAVAHIVCLTPAPLCLQQFVGSGNSKAAPIVICKMFVCICVFFRVALWGVVCVYHKTKPNQNKRMRKNENKQMKTIKRKCEFNNKWSRQSFPLERADSWMR